MNPIAARYVLIWGVALASIAGLAIYAQQAKLELVRSEFITGYVLFGIMLALALLNARKKLSMVPLVRSAYWLAVHAIGGMMALGLFFIHTGNIWPEGVYEQAFAILFYLLSLSGIFGYVIQRLYPKRLVQTDFEIVYERIPAEIAEIRGKAEAEVHTCTEESGSDTLARHYIESLSWYFRRPRFFLNHAVGGQAGAHWTRNQRQAIDRYLSDAERVYLDRLDELARYKNRVDFHYACQSIMKYWLLVHVPLASAVLALMFWHVIVVNVYAL